MFTFKTLSLNAVKSLFTFNLTGKQLVKTVALLLKFQIAYDFHPSKRITLKKYSMCYSEIENNELESSNRSTSLSYQRDCILTFRTFCWPLTNLTVLTKINHLVGMEMKTHASQFFPFSWFFLIILVAIYFINCFNSPIANSSYPPWKTLPISSISF